MSKLKKKLADFENLLDWIAMTKVSELRRKVLDSKINPESLVTAINAWRSKVGAPPCRRLFSTQGFQDLRTLQVSRAFALADSLRGQLSAAQKRNWLAARLEALRVTRGAAPSRRYDECIDRLMGLDERRVKREVWKRREAVTLEYGEEDIYLDHAPEDLFTPYRQLALLFHALRPREGQSFVDLGSGLGRVGLALGVRHPRAPFLGLELVKERYEQSVQAAKELGLKIRFERADLSRRDLELPAADYYFLFNPFSAKTLRRCFQNLAQKHHAGARFAVIAVQVGRPPRFLKNVKWLKRGKELGYDRKWPGHGLAIYHTI